MRFAVAKKIVERAADHGIPREDVVVDPLVMPIGALGTPAGRCSPAAPAARGARSVNTTCGASNISFGLPNRHGINGAFLADGDRRGHDVGDHEPAPAEVMAGGAWPPTC